MLRWTSKHIITLYAKFDGRRPDRPNAETRLRNYTATPTGHIPPGPWCIHHRVRAGLPSCARTYYWGPPCQDDPHCPGWNPLIPNDPRPD